MPLPLTSFTQLDAWKQGHKLVLMIYRLSNPFPQKEDFGLTSQMRRAAISITSNLAEGFSRNSYREKIQFYSIAMGSLTEIQNQCLVCYDVQYISKDDFNEVANQSVIVSKLIRGLIKKSRSNIQDSKFKSQDGSILLEILLTFGAVLIVILGLVLAILAGTQLQLRGQRQALASQLAGQEFEILRARPVSNLGNQTAGPLIGNPEPALTNLPAGQAQLTINDYQNDPNLKEVTLEISFAEGRRAIYLTFATLLGAGGLND